MDIKNVRLGDICEFINGDRGKNYPSGKDFVPKGIPFINAGHIVDNKISFGNMNYITKEKYEALGSGKIQKNDILYCLRGSLGKNAIVDINEGAIASSLVILRPKKDIVNTDYLLIYLNSKEIEEQINKANNGSSQPNLSAKSVKEFKILLPSYDFQKKISKVLLKAQELIDKRKEQIEALDELVKSKFIEMFGDPISNPINWEIKKVGDIAFVTKLAGFEYTQYINYKDEGEVIVVKGLNVKEKKLKLDNVSYIDKETSDLLPRSQLKENDLVMTYVGINIGDVALVDGINRYHLAPNVAKISLLEEVDINPVFMVNLLYMSRTLFSSGATSTAKQALNMGRIREIDIMIPPVELQNKFADFVNQVDKLKADMEKSLKELEDNFNSLMQKVFKGEVF